MKLFKNPAAKHYFKTGLKKNRKFFVICLILHMISFPLAFAMLSVDVLTDNRQETLFDIFTVLAYVFTTIAVLMGVIIAIHSFSYLHKKPETDTYMSLPLSDKQRFFSDYFSGLLTYIAPVMISSVFTFISIVITNAVINSNPASGMSIGSIVYNEYTISWAAVVLEVYIIAIVAMIMFYTLITLACTLCGSLFETIVHSFILNGAIPGMIALLCFVMFSRVPGVDYFSITLPIMSKTSPLGAFIGYIVCIAITDEVWLFPFFIKFVLWLAAFAALYLGLAFLAYKKRKAEDVAKPYVFKGYYYGILSCMTFAICSVIPIEYGMLIIPMIVVAAVAFLAFEVITSRGFKKFGKSLIKCAFTITASILLIGILDNGWGFGAGRRVPDADDVKSVCVRNLETATGIEMYPQSVDFFEKDAIGTVIRVHEMAADRVCDGQKYPGIIKNYKGFDYGEYRYDGYGYVETTYITYTFKNGSTVSREYKLTQAESEILSEILYSKDYAKAQADKFRSDYGYGEWGATINVCDMLGINEYCITAEDVPPVSPHTKLTKSEYTAFIDDIAKAIELDFADRTREQRLKPYAYCGRVGDFDFYEYDENILATLREHNFPVMPVSEYIDKYDNNPIKEMQSYADDGRRYFLARYESDEMRELVKEVLRVAQRSSYRDSEYSYRIKLYSADGSFLSGSETYSIPDEYSDIARELFVTGLTPPQLGIL